MRENMKHLKKLVAAATALLTVAGSAHAADPIKIGEINHYKRLAAFAEPYKKGIELALDGSQRRRWRPGPSAGVHLP
jgi:Skp family chaperone for outer membrane proteins